MSTDTFDLIAIGSGPAGEKGAAQAAYFGKRVALVERERTVPDFMYREKHVVGSLRGMIAAGYAEFENAHTVRVTDMEGRLRLLAAPVILIASA